MYLQRSYKDDVSTILTIGEAAERMGLHPKTLQRWDRCGRLVAQRTATNRRYYTLDQIDAYLRRSPVVQAQRVVAYCRVSSQAQRPDLDNQVRVVAEFCAARGLAGVEVVKEIGGGLNFKRKFFNELVLAITRREVGTLVVAHKDRFARFGFDLLANLCEANGCTLLVLNQEHLSPEREMVEDMLAIVHCFSARLYGLRNYRKALAKALAVDGSGASTEDSDVPVVT